MSASSYPVRVDAHLDPALRRWRWLMSDQYQPVRVDQEDEAPDAAVLAAPGPAPVGVPPSGVGSTPGSGRGAGGSGGGWTAWRVAGVVVATALVLGFLAVTAGGVVLLVADNAVRDDAGFLMSDATQVRTESYALTSPSVEVNAEAPVSALPEAMFGDVKVSVRSDEPVFVGIAATADVERYLGDVRHETLDLVGRPDDVHARYALVRGGPPSGGPAAQDFWVTQSSGSGDQSVEWAPHNGDWTVVLMDLDARRGVHADVAVGAEVPALSWLVPLSLWVGGVGFVLALVVLVLLLRGASKR